MPGVTRDEFLEAVRKATARKILPHTHDTGPVEDEPGRIVKPGAPLGDTFAERAEAAGMYVHRIPVITEAREAVIRIIREEKTNDVLVWSVPVVEEMNLLSAFPDGDVKVDRWDPALPSEERKAKAFAATCGVTGVDWAVAETGSLVVSSSPERGRSVSLMGRVHIALVKADQIVPDLYDLFPRILTDCAGGLPGNITLITGPSKTADIELQLVIGVHGPGAVHVVLVGE